MGMYICAYIHILMSQQAVVNQQLCFTVLDAGTSLINKSWDTSWSGSKIGKSPSANALIMDCSEMKKHVYKMRFCCCCYCCFPKD